MPDPAPPAPNTALTKPADTSIISVAEAKETALTIIRGLLTKYDGKAQEDLLQLLDSINPDKEG